MNKKSIAGGAVGIVGSVFALIGAIGLATCAGLADAVESVTGSGGNHYELIAWIFGIAATAVGLTGAIMCFKKAPLGGILQLVSAVLILVVSIILAFSALNIIAMILLAVGAVLAFVLKK